MVVIDNPEDILNVKREAFHLLGGFKAKAMASHEMMPRKLWEHADPTSTAMYKFMQTINQKEGLQLKVRPCCCYIPSYLHTEEKKGKNSYSEPKIHSQIFYTF